MDAWAKILSGKKTHGATLTASGFVIAMYQGDEITLLMAGFLLAVSASISTIRFGMAKGGTS